jgi:hypothetical protein
MSSARVCAQRWQGRAGPLSAAIDLVPNRNVFSRRNVRPALGCRPQQRRLAAGTTAQAASAPAATDELRKEAAATGTNALFQPLKLGAVELGHRVVMAPLTRCRQAALRRPSTIPSCPFPYDHHLRAIRMSCSLA